MSASDSETICGVYDSLQKMSHRCDDRNGNDCILGSVSVQGSALRVFPLKKLLSLPLCRLFLPQGYEEEEAAKDAFDVSLTKNAQGLGITIAGYVGDKNSGRHASVCLSPSYIHTHTHTHIHTV